MESPATTQDPIAQPADNVPIAAIIDFDVDGRATLRSCILPGQEEGSADVSALMTAFCEKERDESVNFKPHQISASGYKFISGGCFRTSSSEVSTVNKEMSLSPTHKQKKSVNPTTPCKACGIPLGALTTDSYDGSFKCYNCAATFHVCVDGDLKYGTGGSAACAECLKEIGGNALPETFVSRRHLGNCPELEDDDIKVTCPACKTSFITSYTPVGEEPYSHNWTATHPQCSGCGANYFVCAKKVVHWGIDAKRPCKCFAESAGVSTTDTVAAAAPGDVKFEEYMAKKGFLICVACGGDELSTLENGNTVCKSCEAQFHSCKNGMVMFGTTGPKTCGRCGKPAAVQTVPEEFSVDAPTLDPIKIVTGAVDRACSKMTDKSQPARTRCDTKGEKCPLCQSATVPLASWSLDKSSAGSKIVKWSRQTPNEHMYCAACRLVYTFGTAITLPNGRVEYPPTAGIIIP